MSFSSSKISAWVNRNQYLLALFIGLVISFFPLFYRLDAHPIFLWDEARQAANMIEMVNNGNPFITFFEGAPDHYNTKPPLLIWLQALFMLITDNAELSLRLPSALAGLGVCLGVIWFFNTYLSKPFWGVIAALILVSTSGFIELHGTRTGDYDALITLWIFLSTAQFLLYLRTNKDKHLYLFYLFFGLGIATKGPVPLMTLPILLIWTTVTKNLKTTLSNSAFYKGMLIPLVFILIFYGIRSFIDPGYLSNTWHNDFGGRYGGTIDGHDQPFNYYWLKLISERAKYFFILLPLGLLTLFSKNKDRIALPFFGLSFIALFLLILSLGQTKIYWYDTPIFPFIALVLTSTFLFIFNWLKKRTKPAVAYVITSLSVLLIIIFPYQHNVNKVILNDSYSWEGDEFYEPSILLKKAILGEINIKGYSLLYDNKYLPHYQFYIDQLERKRGYKVKTKVYLSALKKGEQVIYFQPHKFKDSLTNHRPHKILQTEGNYIQLIELTSPAN